MRRRGHSNTANHLQYKSTYLQITNNKARVSIVSCPKRRHSTINRAVFLIPLITLTSMAPPAPPILGLKRAPIDVYKKVSVLRSSTDFVVYEDSEGRLQRINDLGQSEAAEVPLLKQKTKQDIPIPTITVSDSYYTEVPPTYKVPTTYAHHRKQTAQEISQAVDYIADEDDEVWLKSQPDFDILQKVLELRNGDGILDFDDAKAAIGPPPKNKKRSSSKASKRDLSLTMQFNNLLNSSNEVTHTHQSRHEPRRHLVSIHIFEQIIDVFEKATAFESVVTLAQGESLIFKTMPMLAKELDFLGSSQIQGEQKAKIAITMIYDYWIQKRSKLRKPLLRKFWPLTASHDTNPHLVFRPREKGKYRLRKKRQNDIETLRKMKQLRCDFDKVRVLLDLIRSREQLNRTMFDLRTEWFDQRMYDMTDTSGLPRLSDRLSFNNIEELTNVPTLIDIHKSDRSRKNKRKKVSLGGDVLNEPIPMDGNVDASSIDMLLAPTQQVNVASAENPISFLDPLPTRDIFAVSWEKAVPFITSYVDSHPVPTFRFRHRPRIGRGGRVIIDRLPLSYGSDYVPTQVYRAGDELVSTKTDNQLLDLLPMPLDYSLLSRRIEEISAAMLTEDDMDQEKIYTKTHDMGKNNPKEILVRMDDWLTSDENAYGEEKYVIGPI